MRQGVRRCRVRGAHTPPVEQNKPGEGGKPAVKEGEPWVLPDQVDAAEDTEGHDQVRRSVTKHLVGDPIVAQARVLGFWLHGPPLLTTLVILGRLRALPPPMGQLGAVDRARGSGWERDFFESDGPASERLTSRLTVARDLRKRRSAQR
jgi:hypothetical protein